MKVLTIVVIIGLTAVCALPLENKSENEKLELLANFEGEADEDVEFASDLIRDKRQYGGKNKY